MSDYRQIPINSIAVGDRMRGFNKENIDGLVNSISAIGLLNPITVYDDGDQYVLVTGLHRLEALKQIGETIIGCVVVDLDELDRELWEIDENLIRAELTKLEHDQHMKRRKEIFDAKGGQTLATPGGQQEIGFAKDTAEKTGQSKSSINQSVARAEKIAPDVQEAIADMPEIADKGVELDALASVNPDEQRAAIELVKSGNAATVRNAVGTVTGTFSIRSPAARKQDFIRQTSALKRAWNDAEKVALDWFVGWLTEGNSDAVAPAEVKKLKTELKVAKQDVRKFKSHAADLTGRIFKLRDRIHTVEFERDHGIMPEPKPAADDAVKSGSAES